MSSWRWRPSTARSLMKVTADGLTAQEASVRLAGDGTNVLITTGRLCAWRILLAQFGSVLIWLLSKGLTVGLAFAMALGLIGVLVGPLLLTLFLELLALHEDDLMGGNPTARLHFTTTP